jgi:hypothetical protein
MLHYKISDQQGIEELLGETLILLANSTGQASPLFRDCENSFPEVGTNSINLNLLFCDLLVA